MVTTLICNAGFANTRCCWQRAEQIGIEEARQTVRSAGEAVQRVSQDAQHASLRQNQQLDVCVVATWDSSVQLRLFNVRSQVLHGLGISYLLILIYMLNVVR